MSRAGKGQLQLFEQTNPLAERLGEDFFRRPPSGPGVYIMTDARGNVLYVGQSAHLRDRLRSYKNAKQDRAARKTLRLIQLVTSITWEPCESADAAVLRENELLRRHRPKFNVLNTYPDGYWFVQVRAEPNSLEINRAHEPDPRAWSFGAFKGGLVPAFGALLRSLWLALYRPSSPFDFPVALHSPHPLRRFEFKLLSGSAGFDEGYLGHLLAGYFRGEDRRLLDWLTGACCPADACTAALWKQDLETLDLFLRVGPNRNLAIRRSGAVTGPLVPSEALDDLLAICRSTPGLEVPEGTAVRKAPETVEN